MAETKDVELRIRARDYSQKTWQQVTAAIRQLTAAQSEQQQAAQKGEASAKDLADSYSKLESAGKELLKLNSLVEVWKNHSAAMEAANLKVSEAQAKHAELQAALAATEKATKRQESAVASAARAITTAERQQEKAASRYARTTDELTRYGIAVEDVGRVQTQIVAQVGALNATLERQEEIIQAAPAAAKAYAAAQAEKARADKAVADAARMEMAAIEDAAYAQNRMIDNLRRQGSQALDTASNIKGLAVAIKALPAAQQSGLAAELEGIASPAQAARATLAGLEKQIADLSAAARGAGSNVTQAREAVSELGQAQQAIMTTAKLVDLFQANTAAVRSARAEFVKARTDLKAVAEEARNAGGASTDMAARLQAAQSRMDSTAAAVRRASEAARASQAALKEAGADTQNLADVSGRLTAAMNVVADTRKAAVSAAQDQAVAEKLVSDALKAEQAAAEEAAHAQNRIIDNLRRQADQAIATAKGYKTLGRVMQAQVNTDGFTDIAGSLRAIVSPAEAARATLGGLTSQVNDLDKEVTEAGKSVTDIRKKIQELNAAQQSAIGMAKLIDVFHGQTEAVRQSRAEFSRARADVMALADQMRRAQGDTAGYGSKLQQAQVRLQAAEAALRSNMTAAQQSQAALRKAGIDTRFLTSAEVELTDTTTKATSTINKLTQALQRNGKEARDGAAAFKLFGDSGRTTLSYVQRLKGELLALVTAYVGVQGAINLAGGAVDAYKMRQQAMIKISTVVGDSQAAQAAEWEYIVGLSDKLGIKIETLASSYTKFAVAAGSVGMTLDESKYIFESIAKAGRVYQLSADDMEGAFKAIEQMLSKGQVYAEELRGQLGERLPGAVAMFAKQMGITVGELQQKLEKGIVQSSEVINLARGMEQATASQVEAASKSADAMEMKANNAMTMFKLAIADSGFMEAYIALLQKLTDWLKSPEGISAAKGIGDAFTGMADAMIWCIENTEMLKALFLSFVAIKAAMWAYTVGDSLLSLALATKEGTSWINKLIKVMGFLWSGVTKVKALIGGMLDVMAAWGTRMIAAGGATKVLGLAVRGLARAIPIIGWALLAYDIGSIMYEQSETFRAAVDLIVSAAKMSGKAIYAAFSTIPAAYRDLIIRMLRPLDDVLGGAVTSILTKLSELAKGVPLVGDQMSEVYSNMAKDIQDKNRSTFAGVQAVWDSTRDEWGNVQNDFVKFHDAAMNLIGDKAEKTAERVTSAWAVSIKDQKAALAESMKLPQPADTNAVSDWAQLPKAQAPIVAEDKKKDTFEFTKDPGTGANARSREVAELTAALGKMETAAKKADVASREALMRKNLPGRLALIDEEFKPQRDKAQKIGGDEGKALLARIDAVVAARKKAEENEYNAAGFEAAAHKKAETAAERRRKALEALSQKYKELESSFTLADKQQDPTASLEDRKLAALQKISVAYDALKRKAAELGGVEGAMLIKNFNALEAKNKQYMAEKMTLEEIERLQKRLEMYQNIRKSGLDEINAKKQAGVISEDQAVAETNTLYEKTNPQVRQAANDLAYQTQMNTDLLGPEKTAEIMANIAQVKAGLNDLSGTYTQTQTTIVEGLTNGVTESLQSVADSLAGIIMQTSTWGDLWNNLGQTVANFFSSLLAEMAAAIIKQQILNAMASMGGGWGSAAQAMGGVVAKHNGGAIGSSTTGGMQARSAPTAWFANAPRYHTGGFPGLKSDEVPAILQKGEQVLSKDDPNNILNQQRSTSTSGSAGGDALRVVMVDDRDNVADAMNSAAGERVVVRNIRRNVMSVRTMINKGRR